MPALCCYDTYISLKMTLKCTRGSNIVLFIYSLGRILETAWALQNMPLWSKPGLWHEDHQQMWNGKPGHQGIHDYCPQLPVRAASLGATQRDEPWEDTPCHALSLAREEEDGIEWFLPMYWPWVHPVQKHGKAPHHPGCVNSASVWFRPHFSPGTPLQWNLQLNYPLIHSVD